MSHLTKEKIRKSLNMKDDKTKRNQNKSQVIKASLSEIVKKI